MTVFFCVSVFFPNGWCASAPYEIGRERGRDESRPYEFDRWATAGRPYNLLRSLRLIFLQLRDVIAQSRFELVLRIESQLRARSVDVHARARRRQFTAAQMYFRKDRFQRAFDIFQRRERAAAEIVNLMRQ